MASTVRLTNYENGRDMDFLSTVITTSTLTTIVSITSAQRIALYRHSMTPDNDVTGSYNIAFGTTTIHAEGNPLGSNPYGANYLPNRVVGGRGSNLRINNTSSASTMRLNIAYEIMEA